MVPDFMNLEAFDLKVSMFDDHKVKVLDARDLWLLHTDSESTARFSCLLRKKTYLWVYLCTKKRKTAFAIGHRSPRKPAYIS